VIFTTDKSKVYDSIVYANSFSDHDMVGVIRRINFQKYSPKTAIVRDYSKYDNEAIKTELRNMPWENCMLLADFNSAWNLFKHYLTLVINKHVPQIEIKIRGKQSPWLTRDIKTLMNSRDYHLRNFKRTNLEVEWSSYKRLRNRVTNLIRTAKANHVRKTFRENVHKPRDFWKQIKKCYPTKESSQTSKSFNIENIVTTDKQSIANTFCSFFTMVGSSLVQSPVVNLTWKLFNLRKYLCFVNPKNTTFTFTLVSLIDVTNALNSIRSSKAAGIDCLPASVIKDCSYEIAAPLMFLINMSLQTSTFPTSEKSAKITPLFKSGNRTNIDNYRPISVLNILSKVIERIVYNQLTDYLESHKLLSQYQFGFRRGKSTKDAVTNFADNIRVNMDKGNLTGSLFMDLRKAFDTVNHGCLLQKLTYYGIQNKELWWISSYLFHRSQTVCFDGKLSERSYISHGVPKGPF
jgi:hypothetical protein